MSSLPQPRGPVSEALFAGLRRPPHALELPAGEIDAEDLQLALYCCYELHYRGFEDVDDAWEWEPSLLALPRASSSAASRPSCTSSSGRPASRRTRARSTCCCAS